MRQPLVIGLRDLQFVPDPFLIMFLAVARFRSVGTLDARLPVIPSRLAEHHRSVAPYILLFPDRAQDLYLWQARQTGRRSRRGQPIQ
jgi:hypothetical protein